MNVLQHDMNILLPEALFSVVNCFFSEIRYKFPNLTLISNLNQKAKEILVHLKYNIRIPLCFEYQLKRFFLVQCFLTWIL
jgi:hypothetical protein